jgi:hypothetical protein
VMLVASCALGENVAWLIVSVFGRSVSTLLTRLKPHAFTWGTDGVQSA